MAKGKETALATNAPPKSQPELSPDVQAALAAVSTITAANFYEISRNGKKTLVPDARALQHLANNQGGITTQIMEFGIDETKAWARVRGWFVDSPEHYKEDVCSINFKVEFASLVWDRFAHGCGIHKQQGYCPVERDDAKNVILKGGVPSLTDSRCAVDVVRQINRIARFGDRICVTKAEGRIHEKLLNVEWREPEEIESTETDKRLIDNKQPSATAKPTAAPATAAKPAPAAQEAQPATQAPAAAQSAAVPAEKPIGPPRAVIPDMMKPPLVAAADAAAPVKKGRTARAEVIQNAVSCSQTQLLTFMKQVLGVAKIEEANRDKLDGCIRALEVFLEKYGNDDTARLIRNDMKDQPDKVRFFTDTYDKESKKQ